MSQSDDQRGRGGPMYQVEEIEVVCAKEAREIPGGSDVTVTVRLRVTVILAVTRKISLIHS